MLTLLVSVFMALQTPPASAPPPAPPSAEQAQADGQAAVQAMAEIFKVMGSCERHFAPEQIRGVRRAIDPEPGRPQTSLQAYLDQAYQTGKADRSWTAPMCQQAMQSLSEAKAANP